MEKIWWTKRDVADAKAKLEGLSGLEVMAEINAAHEFIATYERIAEKPRQTRNGVRKGLSRDEKAAVKFAKTLCLVAEGKI